MSEAKSNTVRRLVGPQLAEECRKCKWYNPESEEYACGVCPIKEVVTAAVKCVENSAFAGICDEDCNLETAVIFYKANSVMAVKTVCHESETTKEKAV